MARSESSARELGRPVPAQAGGPELDGAVVAVKRVMTAERRVPACMAFQTGMAERGWPTRPTTRKGEYHAPKKRVVVWCDAPRSSLEETRGESRCGCALARSPKVTFGWKCGFAGKCADAGLAEADERQPVPGAASKLAESELDTKDVLSYVAFFLRHIRSHAK